MALSIRIWKHNYRSFGLTTTFTASLAALALLITQPLGAHANVGGPVCNVPSNYPTIQAAVNDSGCTTVKVAAGTYNENVVISHSLTLEGAKAGVDARSRSGSESIINGATSANVTINADNVTVDGFTLNGPSDPGTAALVMQNTNSGENVKDNIINNPGRAASITTSNTTFNKNLVHNSSTSTDGFQANSTPVHDNVVKNNTFDGTVDPAIYNTDINFIEGQSNITVSGNKSTDNGTLLSIFKTDGATVTDNQVVGALGSSAIYIGGGDSNINISDNNVDSAGNGVKVANDFGIGTNSNIRIRENTLKGNNDGIKIGSGAIAADNTVIARRNKLTGNHNYGFENQTTFNAIGTCNWWGSANGPGPVGPGSGDKVTTYVNFAPWSTSPNIKEDCNNANASGDLRMGNPRQRINFHVEEQCSGQSKGSVEYWNFDYPGGLHYKAQVACTYVNPQTGEARFMFQIPSGFPGLSGQYVVAYVKHVKGGPDLYGHNATSDSATATQWCENGVGFTPIMYPVTKGSVKIESE